MTKIKLTSLIKESFDEVKNELELDEKTVDGVINSISDIDDEETDTEMEDDDYYKPDPDDQSNDELEKGPSKLPNVKANIKDMEYSLADLKKSLSNMAAEYKKTKPAKGSEEYNAYVKQYKELDSQIKKLELDIEDELSSGIYEDKSLKEIFQKRAGIIR